MDPNNGSFHMSHPKITPFDLASRVYTTMINGDFLRLTAHNRKPTNMMLGDFWGHGYHGSPTASCIIQRYFLYIYILDHIGNVSNLGTLKI
jgi:hypothetical protein